MAERITAVQRDPFARATLMRETVFAPGKPCTWCGGYRRSSHLFRYWWMSDSSRTAAPPPGLPLFDSISCWRAYG